MMVALAPAVSKSTPFNLTTAEIVIIVVIAVVGGLAVLGWRSRGRCPGTDTKAERDRIEH